MKYLKLEKTLIPKFLLFTGTERHLYLIKKGKNPIKMFKTIQKHNFQFM